MIIMTLSLLTSLTCSALGGGGTFNDDHRTHRGFQTEEEMPHSSVSYGSTGHTEEDIHAEVIKKLSKDYICTPPDSPLRVSGDPGSPSLHSLEAMEDSFLEPSAYSPVSGWPDVSSLQNRGTFYEEEFHFLENENSAHAEANNNQIPDLMVLYNRLYSELKDSGKFIASHPTEHDRSFNSNVSPFHAVPKSPSLEQINAKDNHFREPSYLADSVKNPVYSSLDDDISLSLRCDEEIPIRTIFTQELCRPEPLNPALTSHYKGSSSTGKRKREGETDVKQPRKKYRTKKYQTKKI